MNASARRRSARLVVLTITVVRIPVAILFAALLLTLDRGLPSLFTLGALLLVIEVTDLADGYIARREGAVTEFGAMLDPYADSIARLIVYWALAVGDLVLVFVPLVMALRDVTVAYSRIALARSGRSVAANWSGKIKAIIQGGAAFVLLFAPALAPLVSTWPTPTVSWIVALVTAASAVQYVRAAPWATDR